MPQRIALYFSRRLIQLRLSDAAAFLQRKLFALRMISAQIGKVLRLGSAILVDNRKSPLASLRMTEF